MDEVQRERVVAWLAALRSGEYTQAKDALRADTYEIPVDPENAWEDEDGELVEYETVRGVAYCCLGVACDIAQKAGYPGSWSDNDFFDAKGRGGDSLMPWGVAEWFGLTTMNVLANGSLLTPTPEGPSVNIVLDRQEDGRVRETAAGKNDEGATFAEIADELERVLLS